MLRRRILITAMFLAGLAAANLLAAWCLPTQWDWTRQGEFTLSIETRQLLQNLEEPVEITILASREVRTRGDQHFERGRMLLKDLLERYRTSSPRIQIRELDPSDARQLQQRFPDAVAPCLVLTYGRNEKIQHEVLNPRELLRTRPGTEHQAGRAEFLGEQAITAALKRLSVGRKQTVVYVIEGHGELSLLRAGLPVGMTHLAEQLRGLDFDVRPLNLSGVEQIPKDANLLLLAGPAQPCLPAEMQKVANWLANGGRALLLFDLILDQSQKSMRLGWEPLLEEYGLALGNDRVLTRSIGGAIEWESSGWVTVAEHPLVRALPTSGITFLECRTVRKANSVLERAVALTPLLVSYPAPRAWAEGDLGANAKPEPGGATDMDGPVSMAFAVEKLKGGMGGTPIPALVVVGDSKFAADPELVKPAGQNRFRLILSSLNWLRGRHDLMADIKPQVRDAYRLPGDVVAHRRLVWLPSLFMAATLITAGASVWFVRRHG